MLFALLIVVGGKWAPDVASPGGEKTGVVRVAGHELRVDSGSGVPRVNVESGVPRVNGESGVPRVNGEGGVPIVNNEGPVSRYHKNPLKRQRGRDGYDLLTSTIDITYYHPLEIGKASTGQSGVLHPVLAAPSLRGPPIA